MMIDELTICIGGFMKERVQHLPVYRYLDRHNLDVPSVGETAYLYTDEAINDISEKEFITKRDLMLCFDIKDKKALALLKFMKQCGMALQLGKEYITTKAMLDKFLDEQMGCTITLDC